MAPGGLELARTKRAVDCRETRTLECSADAIRLAAVVIGDQATVEPALSNERTTTTSARRGRRMECLTASRIRADRFFALRERSLQLRVEPAISPAAGLGDEQEHRDIQKHQRRPISRPSLACHHLAYTPPSTRASRSRRFVAFSSDISELKPPGIRPT